MMGEELLIRRFRVRFPGDPRLCQDFRVSRSRLPDATDAVATRQIVAEVGVVR
jgi:hypothetical protein